MAEDVNLVPVKIQLINISGFIKLGGTAQVLFQAANVSGFELENISGDILGISFYTPTPVIGVYGTYTINPGTMYVSSWKGRLGYPLTVYIIGATTNDQFTGQYW
jgi:hypothetical protein